MAGPQTAPEAAKFVAKFPKLVLQLGETKRTTGDTVERAQEEIEFLDSQLTVTDPAVAAKLRKHKNFGKTFYELSDKDKKAIAG